MISDTVRNRLKIALELGLSVSTIARYERGSVPPKAILIAISALKQRKIIPDMPVWAQNHLPKEPVKPPKIGAYWSCKGCYTVNNLPRTVCKCCGLSTVK